ncbi:hypothetical protein CYB_2717 [Synechococcus sp. JA-2-3B'a(2-13)]|nr:hypothetical protein CYB_2717 [Synechococcus sp. JA-2-3B'a(2-13)]
MQSPPSDSSFTLCTSGRRPILSQHVSWPKLGSPRCRLHLPKENVTIISGFSCPQGGTSVFAVAVFNECGIPDPSLPNGSGLGWLLLPPLRSTAAVRLCSDQDGNPQGGIAGIRIPLIAACTSNPDFPSHLPFGRGQKAGTPLCRQANRGTTPSLGG